MSIPHGYRIVTSVRMKRRQKRLLVWWLKPWEWPLHRRRETTWGHWWFEIGDPGPSGESYGWWPAVDVGPTLGGLFRTFFGVEGELNAHVKYGTANANQDFYHGVTADVDEVFYPLAPDHMTDAQIHDCLRKFARGYRNKWRWFFGLGPNCHTFQTDAMKQCGLLRGPLAWA